MAGQNDAMPYLPSDSVTRIKAGLDHPVIDSDGHAIEYLPLVRDMRGGGDPRHVQGQLLPSLREDPQGAGSGADDGVVIIFDLTARSRSLAAAAGHRAPDSKS